MNINLIESKPCCIDAPIVWLGNSAVFYDGNKTSNQVMNISN